MLNWFDWLSNLFTLEGLFHFLTGVGVASCYHLLKARIRGDIVIFRWKYIAIPLVMGIAMYISVQTQENANCVRDFQVILKQRSTVTSENDQLSTQQRQLIFHWIHDLVFPPPEIAALPGTDPARQKWALDLTYDTEKQFSDSIERQREIEEYRAAHQLPASLCGV